MASKPPKPPAGNQIDFFALPAATPISWTHAPRSAPFKKQFGKAAATKPLFTASPASVALQLEAAALDAGYGARAAEAPGVAAADWPGLVAYQRARHGLLMSLLSVTGGRVTKQAFVARVEKTERVGLGFLLGSVLCRLATERWASEVLAATLNRFWHVSVTTDPAASLRHWPAGVQALLPDYVFRAGRHWYTAEAKGSCDGLAWGQLRSGLMQASSVTNIAFVRRPGGGRPLQAAPVKAATCTMAHFRGERLHVAHVDPPAPAGPQEAPAPAWVEPFAALVQLEQALARFDALPTSPQLAPPWGAQGAGCAWRLLAADGPSGAPPLWLGAPLPMLQQRRGLQLALRLLRALLPLCAMPADGAHRARELNAALQAPVPAADIQRAWEVATRQFPDATGDEWLWLLETRTRLDAEGLTRATLLVQLARLALPDGQALEDLAGNIARDADRTRQQLMLRQRLQPQPEMPDAPRLAAMTDAGFIVATA